MFRKPRNDAGSNERRNDQGNDEAPRTDGGSNVAAQSRERRSSDATESEHTGLDGVSSVEELELGNSEPEEPELDIDLVFSLLGTSRRRAVIRYLEAEPLPVEIGDLANHIAAHEYGKSVEDITSDERKRVYVSLYQCHLPKMANAGVIRYEQGDPVERGPRFDTFATMLTHADETIHGDAERSRLSSFLAPLLK